MDDLNRQPVEDQLTQREREIVRLMADGLSNQDIAARLFITLNTVKWYLKQIYGKLHVGSRTQAIAVARASALMEAKQTTAKPDHPQQNLPVQLTSFIGREREIAEIKRLLGTTHLLTLTGSGGVGKTRLSLQVAADLLDGFEQGVWFVELATISNPALLPDTVAAALGVPEEPTRSTLEMLIDYVRDKQLLLVLDNCEHLIAASARLALTLLRVAPELRILATSREGMVIPGEMAWRVPSLTCPNTSQTEPVVRLTQYEAVQLLIDRATVVQPSFALTSQNAPAVAQICAQLDGIPLAIELAAARVNILKAEQIAARLDDRFRLLTGGSRTALPRHQTLRALIDWSYDLLSEPERVLLRRLSVFVGGWTLEAVEGVCVGEGVEPTDVLDLLARLVDKSLVVVADERGTQAHYRLLDTIRQYAWAKLHDANEVTLLQSRHLDFFLALAEQAETHLHGPERVAWFDQLAAERGNLRTALERSLTDAKVPEGGLQLVGGEPLSMSENSDNQNKVAWSVFELANVTWAKTSNPKQATALYQECLARFQEVRNKLGIATSLFMLGEVAKFQGEHKRAEILYKRSLALSQHLPSVSVVVCLASLAGLAQALNKPERAARLIGALEAFIEGPTVVDDPGVYRFVASMVTALHKRLDAPEMAALWAEGRAMTIEQAMSYALEEAGSVR